MHTHGTAVLDRPAGVTVPASTLLSVPFPRAGSPDLESVKSIRNAEELTTGFGGVRGQEVTELAVALYASGIRPRSFQTAGAAQLMEWAVQGLALLGIDRVRHYARRTQFLHCWLFARLDPNRSAHKSEYDRMWPCSARIVQSYHDAAWRLFNASPASQNTPTSRTARSALH
jgi:hypothetical protein